VVLREPGCYSHAMRVTDMVRLAVLSAVWGSSFIFIRYLAPIIGPVATADARMFLAGLALVIFFLITGFKADWRKNWRHFLVVGILNSALPFLLYSMAALVLPGAVEAIFNSLSPMFGAIFAAIWLGERFTLRRAAGLIIGVGGVVIMSSLGGFRHDAVGILALAACVLAPLCYGLAGVYIKRKAPGVKPMAFSGGSQLVGGLVLMPFLPIAPPSIALVDARVVLLVVAFALLCSAIAYIIYYRLIADIGPTKALTVTFLIPVFAMLWGFLFLKEAVSVSMILGALVILGGTLLVVAPAGLSPSSPQRPRGRARSAP
jgi:drug/metabolite transporter (DMT)-like permease